MLGALVAAATNRPTWNRTKISGSKGRGNNRYTMGQQAVPVGRASLSGQSLMGERGGGESGRLRLAAHHVVGGQSVARFHAGGERAEQVHDAVGVVVDEGPTARQYDIAIAGV